MNALGNHRDDQGVIHVLIRFDAMHLVDGTTITRYLCTMRDKWFWGRASAATKEPATCLACIAAE